LVRYALDISIEDLSEGVLIDSFPSDILWT
jgi:hypothetical protein